LGSAVRFRQINVPRQQGELARFKVIQGADYGSVYVIVGASATIGRGEENDIILSDLKASRVHAELVSVAGGWVIRDKGSANGIFFRGAYVRELNLKVNDVLTLGETTLEFIPSEAGTMMLVASPRSFDQVQREQRQFESQQRKLHAVGLNSMFSSSNYGVGVESSGSASGGVKPIYWVLGGLAIIVLSVSDPPVNPKVSKSKQSNSDARDLASYLPSAEINKSADSIFKEGFREYLAGNLSRARTQFETVLQISPGHPLATLYITNCNNSVESEVKINKEQGKKSLKAGKLKDARIHFRRILRLLNRDRSNPEYIEAKSQCEAVEKEMEIKASACEGDKS